MIISIDGTEVPNHTRHRYLITIDNQQGSVPHTVLRMLTVLALDWRAGHWTPLRHYCGHNVWRYVGWMRRELRRIARQDDWIVVQPSNWVGGCYRLLADEVEVLPSVIGQIQDYQIEKRLHNHLTFNS